MAGAPRNARSVPTRIFLWFTRHPEEELTNHDMQVKFDLSKKQVDHALHYLRHRGELAVVKTTAPCTYRLADPNEAAQAYEEITEWRDRWLTSRGLTPSPQA